MLSIFAFTIDCIGPNSESGVFWFILFFGSLWVFVSSLLLRTGIAVCNSRKTLHTKRTNAVAVYTLGASIFYILSIIGALFGKSSEGTCKNPSSSNIGVLAPFAIIALVTAVLSVVVFIFWFKKKGQGQKLIDIPEKNKLLYSFASFLPIAILTVFGTILIISYLI